ncbi:MAG: hypothetical protein Q4B15_09265 [Lachnospiraceae bacterium]|nr:hypothetical protein [Lachnospiraceae bacterium]
MGRKVQVTKEQMLEAGLQIIIRDGYSQVSIKSVAAELSCSTSPIAWSFGSIQNFREELRRYAVEYMQKKMQGSGSDTLKNHRNTGEIYIDMAIDEPNLIFFLREDESYLRSAGGIGFIFDKEKNAAIIDHLSSEMGISGEDAVSFIQAVTSYTEGIVSMILSGVIPPDKESAHRMAREGGAAFAMYYQMKGKGIPPQQIQDNK